MKSATAFAPATVANVAVGFDILGFAFDAVGDVVTVATTEQPTVTIREITDVKGEALDVELPLAPARNTATIGLIKLREELGLDFGFEVSLRKGIALGSGMGGSAASAVAALMAANSLLERPLAKESLLEYALLGEQAASGTAHPDNVTPCLYGGMTLVTSVSPFRYVQLPVPANILTVVVHPHCRVDTRDARRVLKPDIPLSAHVRQSANLGGFIAGCYTNDLELLRQSFVDVLIEPQRASLIPAFAAVRSAALEAEALGVSISGSGPSVFAWASSEQVAVRVREAIVRAFQTGRVSEVDSWAAPVSREGARVIG
jgi:homoserine kinase